MVNKPATHRRRFEIEVKKDVYVEAKQGESIWPAAPSYAELHGETIIESVSYTRHGPVTGSADPTKYYYCALLRRRRSHDNGETWEDLPILFDQRERFTGSYERREPHHFLDPGNGILLSITADARWDCADGKPAWQGEQNLRSKTMRMYYEMSRDGGWTWMPGRQIIHSGSQYDETHWLPGVKYGANGASYIQQRFARMDDGTIIVPIIVSVTEGNTRNILDCDHQTSKIVAFLLGRWKPDLSGLDWTMSETIDCPPDERPSGISEPDLVYLGGRSVFATFRAMGNERRKIPSLRMCAHSLDGARSWSRPIPLTYDDESPVWVPAAPSIFFRSTTTGRVYWVANILSAPVYGSYPRHPLAIAEFDTERHCLIKDTVRTIQELPQGAPEGRRYSNFGGYVDRRTGEFVLTMPEEPKINWEDYTADAVRYRVRVIE